MGLFNNLKQKAFEMAKEQAMKQLEEKFGSSAAGKILGGLGEGGGGGAGGGHKVTQDEYEANKPQELRKDIRMISGCQDKQTSADVSNVSSFQLPDPCGEFQLSCTNFIYVTCCSTPCRPCWRSIDFDST